MKQKKLMMSVRMYAMQKKRDDSKSILISSKAPNKLLLELTFDDFYFLLKNPKLNCTMNNFLYRASKKARREEGVMSSMKTKEHA